MGKNKRIYDIQTIIKEYFLIFLLLAAFNGFNMWIYQIFANNGMLESHKQTIINLLTLYVVVTSAIITTILLFIHRYLLTSLNDLCKAVQKIADGDFTIRIISRFKKRKQDFIDVLFDNINLMTEKLAFANEKLKALSITDELTKLNNRRSFLEYISLI
jgi:methyl-accepting chemotaxis protein